MSNSQEYARLEARLAAAEQTIEALRKEKSRTERKLEEALAGQASPRDTEQALLESEARLSAIINNSPTLIFLKDCESRLLLINDAYARHYGVDRDVIIGNKGRAWLDPVLMEKMLENDRQVVETGESNSFEYSWQAQGGQKRYMSSVKFPVRDKRGDIIGVGGHTIDVTDLKIAEQREEENSRLLQTTLDHVQEGITVYDSDLNLLAFNQVFVDLFGYPPGFVRVGLNYEDLAWHNAEVGHYGPGDVEDLVSVRVERARTMGPRQFERTGNNGKTIAIWRNPLPEGGFVSTFIDVTARKQAEDARELARSAAEHAAVAARESNAAKSSFIANLSHEIRTPMNGILGMVELLADSELTEDQREKLDIIRYSGRTLLELLNDILDLSKIEAGHLEIDAGEFSLEEMLESFERFWSPLLADKGVQLSVDNRLFDETQFRSDEGRIRQILTNLVGNAAKFTAQGQVDICVSATRLINGKRGLRFEVNDTGIGIKPEEVGRLFRPFSQADASTTRKFGGTGLGLSISKKLAVLLGGDIGVESEYGKGSTFWFTVQAEPVTLTQESPPIIREEVRTDPPTNKRTLRILVAEDNKINQQVTSAMLSGLDCEIEIVEDGASAVAAATRSDFDIILMDIQMPGMDGVTATRKIRSLPSPACDTPVIAMTANAMTGDRESYLKNGMSDYVPKPIDQDHLLSTIGKWTDVRKPERMPASTVKVTSEELFDEGLEDEFDALMEQFDVTKRSAGS